MTAKIFRAIAWSLLAAILILSLVPPSLRPVTGAPHGFEHFSIFALCGLAFGLGYRVAGIFEGIGLVVFSAAVEVLQLLAPGRHARLIDFAVDAIASCAGVLIGRLAQRVTAGDADARER